MTERVLGRQAAGGESGPCSSLRLQLPLMLVFALVASAQPCRAARSRSTTDANLEGRWREPRHRLGRGTTRLPTRSRRPTCRGSERRLVQGWREGRRRVSDSGTGSIPNNKSDLRLSAATTSRKSGAGLSPRLLAARAGAERHDEHGLRVQQVRRRTATGLVPVNPTRTWATSCSSTTSTRAAQGQRHKREWTWLGRGVPQCALAPLGHWRDQRRGDPGGQVRRPRGSLVRPHVGEMSFDLEPCSIRERVDIVRLGDAQVPLVGQPSTRRSRTSSRRFRSTSRTAPGSLSARRRTRRRRIVRLRQDVQHRSGDCQRIPAGRQRRCDVCGRALGNNITVFEDTLPANWLFDSIDCAVARDLSVGVTPVITPANRTVTFSLDNAADVLDVPSTTSSSWVQSRSRSRTSTPQLLWTPHRKAWSSRSTASRRTPTLTAWPARWPPVRAVRGVGDAAQWLLADGDLSKNVTVDNNATCADATYVGESIGFGNTPLTDVTITVNSQVPGGTMSTVDCDVNAPDVASDATSVTSLATRRKIRTADHQLRDRDRSVGEMSDSSPVFDAEKAVNGGGG